MMYQNNMQDWIPPATPTPEELHNAALAAIRSESYDAAAAYALTGLLSMAIGAAKAVVKTGQHEKNAPV